MITAARLVPCVLLLGACSAAVDPARPEPGGPEPGTRPAIAAFDVSLDRSVERSFLERPFARGPLAALAVEGGDLMTFVMGPCAGGSYGVAICAGGPEGPRGTLRATPDHLVVEGLYGRRFYLSNGGDGFAERGGVLVPLSWDARTNGTGFGLTPALETAAPHG
jgi:hypothetical protein